MTKYGEPDPQGRVGSPPIMDPIDPNSAKNKCKGCGGLGKIHTGKFIKTGNQRTPQTPLIEDCRACGGTGEA